MRIHVSLIVIVVLTAVSLAQEAPAPSAQAAPAQASDRIPPGTMIAAELTKSVDAKKCKPGDKVEAKITVDLLAHGRIVIPRNTKIVGHVTSAKPHTKESPDSAVAIAFDRMTMKDGQEVPLQASIQAIARPLPFQSSDAPSAGRTTPSPGAQAPASKGSADAPMSVQNTVENYPSIDSTPSDVATSSSVSPLTPERRGAVGMPGVALSSSPAGSAISSNDKNVHLESGTQLMLRIE